VISIFKDNAFYLSFFSKNTDFNKLVAFNRIKKQNLKSRRVFYKTAIGYTIW